MKARAGFLMLLMCIISFTGFSTTTDLIQNSNAFTLDSDFVGPENVKAIVVINNDFNEVFKLKSNIELNLKFRNGNPHNEFTKLFNDRLIHPFSNLKSDFKIYKLPDLKSKNYLLIHKRSRDNISCIL